MVTLSDEAWGLLGMLHSAAHGGRPAPAGFDNAYAELQNRGLALGTAITNNGNAALRERFHSRGNPDLFRSNTRP